MSQPPIHIMSSREAGGLARLNLLIYGPSGAGKTYLAKTTGDPARTLVVAAEPGLLTLRDVDIPVAQVHRLEELGQLWQWLARGDHRFRWVIIDSITEVAKACLDEELSRPGSQGKKRHGLEAYGAMGQRMTANIRRLRDLPCHVVMIAQQERVVTETGGLLYGAAMPGKRLTADLPYHFDEVFALRCDSQPDGTVRRALQTRRDSVYDAKDRSGVLDPFEPADLAGIERKILQPHQEHTQ